MANQENLERIQIARVVGKGVASGLTVEFVENLEAVQIVRVVGKGVASGATVELLTVKDNAIVDPRVA